MRSAASLFLLSLAACASGSSAPSSDWVDLMPGPDFKGWKRVAIKPLAAKKVWSHSPDGKLLLVDGTKEGANDVVEMLLHEEERGDGVFEVEWRYRKGEGEKPVYNGGIYVRTAPDGKTWVQAQVAHAEKSPVVGDLMGMIPGDEKRQDHFQSGPSPASPIGGWNTYRIECRGPRIQLSVNGKPTAVWENCPLLRGHVGLQAEFAFYEVRAIRFKKL
jgi:hypothetical protein